MKNSILYFCIFLTIIFEVIVLYLVHENVCFDRINIIIGRLIIQILILISISNFRISLYVLTLYHAILCFSFFSKVNFLNDINSIFGLYHCLMGLLVYFNEEINKLVKH